MGKRQTSKHAASGLRASAAGLRRLLVALLCGGLVFALSGFALPSATAATRLLSALGAALVVCAGFAIARTRPRGAQAGRRRAIAAPVADEPVQDLEDAQPSFLDEALVVDEDVENVEGVVDVEGNDEPDVHAVADLEDADVMEGAHGADDVEVIHDADAEVVEDVEATDDSGSDATDTVAIDVAALDESDVEADELPDAAPDTDEDTEVEAAPVHLLEELIRQAMAEELANELE